MSRFRCRSVWLVESQHPLPPYPPTTWLPLICGDDWMRECSCFNPALLCYHDRAAMADHSVSFQREFGKGFSRHHIQLLFLFFLFFPLSPYPQVDLFSNSGRRGFCSWQQRAVCSSATMPHLPLTSWCCCRAAARRSWKARRSWICPSCRQEDAGTAASPSSSPRVNTCCCWRTPLQTAGHSFGTSSRSTYHLKKGFFFFLLRKYVREIKGTVLKSPTPQ